MLVLTNGHPVDELQAPPIFVASGDKYVDTGLRREGELI
jgi:hypothetical protein